MSNSSDDESNPDEIDDNQEEESYFNYITMGMNRSIVDASNTQQDENETTVEDAQNAEDVGEYNMDLPTTHRYLGKLDDVPGYTLLDHGEKHKMLGVFTNTMVFPGFTLPLLMNNHHENSVVENYISKKNLFVVLYMDASDNNYFQYGVTMEVFEITKTDGMISLKAKGRQRCRILLDTIKPLVAGNLFEVTVSILAEKQVTSPISNSQLEALQRRRPLVNATYNDMMANYKYRRLHLSQFPYCSWVYDRNEACFYVKCVLEVLQKYYVKEYLPTEAVSLSYWIVQNFQLTHEERLNVLSVNTALERLRLELAYLQLERILCCARCRVDIAIQSDVFPMSKDGVQNNYCNPGGFVYETITVSNAQNFQLIGLPSSEFSWFPGYEWTIIQCRLCRAHLGWRFTSKKLYPVLFYGLAKSGLDIRIINK